MSSRDFSLYGAVDLGARQAAVKKRQERQAAAQTTNGGAGATVADGGAGAHVAHVVDVTDDTFNAEVVERSRTVPVLVDFWAEWCQPCKQLGPVLEKLAAEAAGEWVLAKVDIDANPQLAAYMQQMGIRGIPFVAVVVTGQLMPFLNGAAPEPQVREAIGQLFDALRQEGILPEGAGAGAEPGAGAGEPIDEPEFVAAETALQRGDLDGAAAVFRKILDRSPGDVEAKRGLALVDLSRRVSKADPEQTIRTAAERPDDLAAQLAAADAELISGRIEAAFDRLIGAVRRTVGDDRDTVRKHLLALFEILPAEDPRVGKARRALRSALF